MELDDLRRQWQRQPAESVPPPSTEQHLRAMLLNRPDSPITEMKRNAKRDMTMLLAVLIINANTFKNLLHIRLQAADFGFLLVLLLLLLSAALAFGVRTLVVKWQLLNRMEAGSDNLRDHLRQLVPQFRVLLRTSAHTGLALGGLLVLLMLYGKRAALAAYLNPAAADWPAHLTLFLLLASALLIGVVASYESGKTRRQQRYGQHLDRLEAALRELGD